MDYLKQLIGLETENSKKILITTSDIKYQILSYRNQHQIIDNLKIMTESEFVSGFVFKQNPEHLMYLINNNPWGTEPLQPNLAKQLAKGLWLIDYLQIDSHPLNRYLKTAKEAGYNHQQPKIPSDYQLEIYLPRLSDQLAAVVDFQYPLLNMNPCQVYEYSFFLDEIEAAIEQIASLLATGVKIDQIQFFAPSSYNSTISQVMKVYQIPIAIKNELRLLAHADGQRVYQQLKSGQTIDLSEIDNLLVEPIISILNKYSQYENISDYLPLIIAEFEQTTVTLNTEAGIVVNNRIDSLYTTEQFKNDYFILLGNHQDGLINYMQDTNIVGDQYRSKLFTCDANNSNENNLLYNIINHASNIRLSYAKKLINSQVELANNLSYAQVQSGQLVTVSNFSKVADQLKFARANYINQVFNTKTETYKSLSKFYHNQLVDNHVGFINREYDDLRLSYTSINDFYKCSYKFYLGHVLRIKNGKFDNRKVVVGNIVHHVLENIDSYQELSAVTIKQIIDQYILTNEISTVPSDQIYFDKFSIFLEAVCTYMKQEEANNDYDQIQREVEFTMDLANNVSLTGKIDKILSKVAGDDLFVEIYDYKTGSLSIDVSGVQYGLDMQNLIYFLLIKDYYKNEQGTEVLNGTFQHQIKQKLLYDDEEYLDMMKIKGYSKQKHDQVFKRSEKIISETDVEQLIEMVETKVNQAASQITTNQYQVNPKIIDGKNVSCTYCPYLSICNRTNENYTYINSKE